MITILLTLSISVNLYFIITTLKRKRKMTDSIRLTFYEGREKSCIARSNEGKVCLLDVAYCRKNRIYVKFNEVWRCAIKEEKMKYIIVQPISRLLTAEENLSLKVDELKDKYGKKEARATGKPLNLH
jgi:hypothetical protein